MKRLILALLVALTGAPLSAQAWTTSEHTPSWVNTPAIGDGIDRVAEASTAAQGGDPPALAYEPAAIDENGTYTRTQWIGASASYVADTNGKFRTNCNVEHFLTVDPILYPGQSSAGHAHSFFGNKGSNQNSTYTTLRTSPSSSCAGGPLNATAYWEPTLLFEFQTGQYVAVKPNIITFYYETKTAERPKLYRIPRGFAYIGGVNPSDRLNTAGLAELPNGTLSDGTSWLKTKRMNGWGGWACFNGGTAVPLAVGNTADSSDGVYYARQLVNADGSDPWGGACESASYTLIADVVAPNCWDGYNLTSPNGRKHVRYAAVKAQDQSTPLCPDGWWQIPALEGKAEFPNGRSGGISGHAWRSKLHLSSDEMNATTGLMDANPANWQPRGSTFHFDWMNGWDSVVMNTWMNHCVGVSINSTTDNGDPRICNDSTISTTQQMYVGTASPNSALSNNPPITVQNYYNSPAKQAFGPIATGTTITSATAGHVH